MFAARIVFTCPSNVVYLFCVCAFVIVNSTANIVSLLLLLAVKHNGNINFDDVLSISRIMRPRSMARELSGTVKEILGTAQSVGCTIDGRPPHDVIDDIDNQTIEIPAE